MIRGDMLGRQKDCSMLPCIRHYVNKVLSLTNHITSKQIFKDKAMKRKEAFEFHCGAIYTPNEHTYRMTNIVYGITEEDDKAYERGISIIDSLPSGFNFPKLKTAACIDGSLTGLAATEIVPLYDNSSPNAPEKVANTKVSGLKGGTKINSKPPTPSNKKKLKPSITKITKPPIEVKQVTGTKTICCNDPTTKPEEKCPPAPTSPVYKPDSPVYVPTTPPIEEWIAHDLAKLNLVTAPIVVKPSPSSPKMAFQDVDREARDIEMAVAASLGERKTN